MNPDLWIKALEEWKLQGMGDNGCTLPFLVGIQTQMENPTMPDSSDVKEILEYLFSDENKEEYFIRICPERNWTIIQKGDADEYFGEWYGNHLLIDNRIAGNLRRSPEEIINDLVEESEPIIREGKYSLDKNRVWGDYSVKEKEFIKSLF